MSRLRSQMTYLRAKSAPLSWVDGLCMAALLVWFISTGIYVGKYKAPNFLAGAVASVSFLVFCCATPWCLARNYWRPVNVWHLVTWIVWWFSVGMCYFLVCVFLIKKIWGFTTPEWLFASLFPGIPAFAAAALVLLWRIRSDSWLIIHLLGVSMPVGVCALGFGWNRWLNPGYWQDSVFDGTMFYIGIFALIYAVPNALCFAWLWHTGRFGTHPIIDGLCLGCQYDLTGTVAGDGTQCPECGKAIANEQVALVRKRIQEQQAQGEGINSNPAAAGTVNPKGTP